MSEIIGYNDKVILDQYGASVEAAAGSRSSRPTGSVIETVRLADRLTEIYETAISIMGDKWPAMRDEWQRIIKAAAKKEGKDELAMAIELAKGSPVPTQRLVIMAAAYDLCTQNAELRNGGPR